MIKAAQRLGPRWRRSPNFWRPAATGAAPRPRAPGEGRVKLAEVDAKIPKLATIRTGVAATVEAGCDDLTVCASSAYCPIPCH
ncbi:hypothetical protein QFZ67_007716 [Streptomyces sp. V1I1]|nr:hypothetical protein [Streptomyces sp. V1I1]